MKTKWAQGDYRAWTGMKERNKEYNRFIEPSWRHSFSTFIKDMGEYQPGYRLMRLDKNIGFTKDNCRWSKIVIIER